MSKLSEAEAELYDRQIRLWGIESQEKLKAANVLLIGVRGLGSEIAKDILLSGINSLTIMDPGLVNEEELVKNFFLTRTNLGEKIAEVIIPKAQLLNPLVNITAVCEDVKSKDETFYKTFSIITCTGLNKEEIIYLANICHQNQIKLICGDVFGLFGCALVDLQHHEFYEDRVVYKSGKKRSHDGSTTKNFDKQIERIKTIFDYINLENIFKQEAAKISKRRNPYFFLYLILMEFRSKFKRDPSHKQKEDDLLALAKIKSTIFDELNVDSSKINDTVFPLLFGEIVPICSIVGGVIAQEIIKAVSHKEVPLNNVFLLDPLTFNGKEEIILN